MNQGKMKREFIEDMNLEDNESQIILERFK